MKNIVSVFNAPVSNTTRYEDKSWNDLCDICTDDPIELKDNSHEQKAQHGNYFVRGIINGIGVRNDEGLKKWCHVIILDVDKEPLHSIDFIKEKLDKTGLSYIATNTATKGRSRIIVHCKKYDKKHTENVTRALVGYLATDEIGLIITWVSENKKLSQPWFTPQTTDVSSHKSFCVVDGNKFDWRKCFKDSGIDIDAETAVSGVGGNNIDESTGQHNPLSVFIKELESGTCHEAVPVYAGWLRLTTNWSCKQVFDHIEELILKHLSDDTKKSRWENTGERDGFEKWFESKTSAGYDSTFTFTNYIAGEDYLIDPHNNAPYLPLDVMMPEGSRMAELVDSMLRCTEAIHNPDLSFYFALLLIDHLAGGGYASVASNKLDPLYIFASGQTGDGKTEVINAMEAVFNQTMEYKPKSGEFKVFRKKRLSSKGTGEGKEDDIMSFGDGQDTLCIADEYGLTDQGNNDKSSRADRELVISMRTVARNVFVYPRTLSSRSKSSGKPPSPIKSAHLNIGTMSTDESLKGVIKNSDMGLGYLQRFVGGTARTPHWKTRKKAYGVLQGDEVVNKRVVKNLYKILVNQQGINSSDRRFNSKCYEVKVLDSAIEHFDNLFEIVADSRDPRLNKFVQNMKPIARARAIVECPDKPVVTLSIAEWAGKIVNCSIQYFDYLMGKLHTSSVSPSMVIEDRLVGYGKKHSSIVWSKTKWMNQSRVSAGSSRYGRLDYNPVWEELVRDGVFVEVEDKGMAGKQINFKYIGKK